MSEYALNDALIELESMKARAETAEAALITARENEEREGRENQTLRARVAELEKMADHYQEIAADLEDERDGYRSALADMVATTPGHKIGHTPESLMARDKAIGVLKNGPAKRVVDSVSDDREEK